MSKARPVDLPAPDLPALEHALKRWLATQPTSDQAHDVGHIERVVVSCKQLASQEHASLEVVVPAAWLHDCISLPKNHPQRAQASSLAAERAAQVLLELGYPKALLPEVQHAIRAHSFSADIPCESIEAKILQDADRLDALGAIGIARCLQVSCALQRPLYHPIDPLCETRQPDDSLAAIDHFHTKLFSLSEKMNTAAGKAEAERRTQYMREFLRQLGSEINAGEA
ncbi:HD domain-containing protein [Aliagarivorans taiwanensis]|uniref:HD domain-containing protein n=1 Tax=Aliagarivorans taiwanensis TaxID=561966 RepID=UPI0004069E22|nr:HD domain-containing protein [Aliagarivorans taiwanensis]